MEKNILYHKHNNTEEFFGKTFLGLQSGYEVRFSENGEDFMFITNDGIRGINIPVIIEFSKTGEISVLV